MRSSPWLATIVLLQRLPQRPELDSDVAGKAPRQKLVDRPFAAEDLRVACHFGLKKAICLVHLNRHADYLSLQRVRLRGWCDRSHSTGEALLRIGAGLQHDGLADLNFADLVFRNLDLRRHALQFED